MKNIYDSKHIGTVDVYQVARELHAHGLQTCSEAREDGWYVTSHPESELSIDLELERLRGETAALNVDRVIMAIELLNLMPLVELGHLNRHLQILLAAKGSREACSSTQSDLGPRGEESRHPSEPQSRAYPR